MSPPQLTGDHALDCPVLSRVEHVKGLLVFFKREAVRDERLDVYQLLGQHVDGDGVSVKKELDEIRNGNLWKKENPNRQRVAN